MSLCPRPCELGAACSAWPSALPQCDQEPPMEMCPPPACVCALGYLRVDATGECIRPENCPRGIFGALTSCEIASLPLKMIDCLG